MGNFDENKHPRASDGKFTDGNGRNGDYSESVNERIKWAKENGFDLPLNTDGSVDDLKLQKMYEANHTEKKKGKSQEEFFGEEFTGIKGSAAIEKLLKEKRGHVKNAFERSEIEGGITLVWGDDTGGLGHTIMRRNKQLKDGTGTTSGVDMARKIPEIIEKGTFSMGANGRPNITYHDFLVIVSPTFDGKKVNWVVSAMEPQVEIEPQKKV